MTRLARAGLAASAVTVMQLLGALSVLALVSAPGNDSDELVYDLGALVLVIMAGLGVLCVVPMIVLALMVWRTERFRMGMLVVAVALLAWHVVGTAAVIGSWQSEFVFDVPGPPAITVGYQVVMVVALAIVTVMLARARSVRRELARVVVWNPPPMDDRPPPQPGGYEARHRGGRNASMDGTRSSSAA